MAEKLEDLNLPAATVARIVKDSLPEHVSVGKDAKAALSRAASVFVLFLTSQASMEAQKLHRKTLLGQDIIKALDDLEFDDFIEPLETVFKEFKETKAKRNSLKSKKTEQSDHIEDPEEDQEDEELMDEENAN